MARKRKYKRRSKRPKTSSGPGQQRLIRGVLLAGAAVLLLIFFFGDHGLYQLYQIRQERARIQNEIQQLRATRIRLEAKKQRLENDFEYIERLARERYRMAKKGEKVFKVLRTSD